MKEFTCKKCGSTDLFIKDNGTQTGLYCSDCGKWIKWLGKEELRLVERQINERNKIITREIEIRQNNKQKIYNHTPGLKEFCRCYCQFSNEDGCTCLDDKQKCPINYFLEWLIR